MKKLLICTDLDRTLIPNGAQPESPGARKRFAKLVSRPEVTLAYVTGRHRSLVEEAIEVYQLPQPDYVIADVGSTVYQVNTENAWLNWPEWEQEISSAWHGRSHQDLKQLLIDLKPLRLQELSKQNRYKLSYYVPLHTNVESLTQEIHNRFKAEGIDASLIWSIDEPSSIGLLDVLPVNATKRHAIEFLMQKNQFSLDETIFSGDSGNDLPVAVSPIHAVLVANTSPDVKQAALAETKGDELSQALYIAKGGYLDMNGNYSAGILEGIVHFAPYTKAWIEEEAE